MYEVHYQIVSKQKVLILISQIENFRLKSLLLKLLMTNLSYFSSFVVKLVHEYLFTAG